VVDLSPTTADTPWFTKEHAELRESVLELCAKDLPPGGTIERDRTSTFWREGWEACGRFGIQGSPVPPDLGGQGLDGLSTAVALEALGFGCDDGGLVFSINAHMWSCVVPIWKYGSHEQRSRLLPGLSNGTLIGIHAVTEPEAGSDAFAMTTRAEPDGDGWKITGAKTFISNAPVADVLIVFARTTPGTGPTGITAFLVEPGSEGLQIPGHLEKMGLRTSPMGEIQLEGVRVERTDVVGQLGRGARVFQTSMDWERGLIMSAQVGAMQRVTERTIAYARERKQFGRPIGKFENVADMIAEMKVRLVAARSMLYRAARLVDQAGDHSSESAEAKVFISEASVRTHMDALQIHGGYGYMTEFEIERALRDAIGGTIYSGTSQIQRRLIARRLGL